MAKCKPFVRKHPYYSHTNIYGGNSLGLVAKVGICGYCHKFFSFKKVFNAAKVSADYKCYHCNHLL